MSRRQITVEPMRPGRRIETRIETSRTLRAWADSNPRTDLVDHAHVVTTLAHRLMRAQETVAEDRALTAALLWAEGVTRDDVADLLGVSGTRVVQLLNRAD